LDFRQALPFTGWLQNRHLSGTRAFATDKTKGLAMAFGLLRVVPVRMLVLFEALSSAA
jgi:hypothetical protein